MDYEKDIDWKAIAKNLPPTKDTRILSGALSQYDYYFEKAFTNAANRSMAGDVQSLLTEQLKKHFEDRCKTIYFLASQHDLSFEEAFIRLATDQPLLKK
ncbi:MAG: hypothetical protein AB4372_16875 [Xenococcus sp. (in: cyanobacteria)]